MNAVVYSKPFFPHMGGLERNTLTLCLALQDIGHQVHLVTETPTEEPGGFSFSVTRTRTLTGIFEALSEADLLVVNGNVSLRVHPLAWVRRIPYAVIYHTFRGYRRRGEGIAVTIGSAVRGAVARCAVANVFTNTYAKEKTDLPESTTHVVLNPVGKKMQSLYNGQGKQSRKPDAPFLFAGRIIEGKGIFVLADALDLLDGSIHVQVVVAGEGRDEDRLRERMQGFSTIHVDFAGRLEAPELVEQYQNARALLVPSTTHKEGNPLVIAEAIYAGTPVIASDQPPMVESVQDAGTIVEQGNATELAEAIRVLKTDSKIYADKKKQAEERASFFRYERYREQIKDISGPSSS